MQRLNSGVAAFKYEQYAKAKQELEILAKLGDSTAQDVMIDILGLGLGQAPDFFGAANYMARVVDGQNFAVDRAYDLGVKASSGAFGQNKKAIGDMWLAISRQSGSKLEMVELERKELIDKSVAKVYDDAKK